MCGNYYYFLGLHFIFSIILICIIQAPQQTYALTIVVTGSSQGIGLDAATRLVSDGHTVIHACRNSERSSVAVEKSGGGIPMVCNLSSFKSIRNFVDDLKKRDENDLDVLCLNAAVAPSTKAKSPKTTMDGLEECIGINHLGHFLLANLLKEDLASSRAFGEKGGRLVITASSVHDPEAPGGAVGGKGGATLGDLSGFGIRLDQTPNGPTMPDGVVDYDGGKIYKDSKLCNVLFSRQAQKLWGSNSIGNAKSISIRSFNPGFIPSSGLFREPRKDNWLGATAFTFVMGIFGIAVPIAVGGERLAFMAVADESDVPDGAYFSAEPGSRGITSSDGFGPADLSEEASDDILAAKLWNRSIEIAGLAPVGAA